MLGQMVGLVITDDIGQFFKVHKKIPIERAKLHVQ